MSERMHRLPPGDPRLQATDGDDDSETEAIGIWIVINVFWTIMIIAMVAALVFGE